MTTDPPKSTTNPARSSSTTNEPRSTTTRVQLTLRKGAEGPSKYGWGNFGADSVHALAILTVAFFAGLYTGSSAVPISPTIVPLVFGLVTMFGIGSFFAKRRGIAAITVIVFCFAFQCGVLTGQTVDRPRSVDSLKQYMNLDIGNTSYRELRILSECLKKNGVDGKAHDNFVVTCAYPILNGPGDDQTKAEQLRELTDRVANVLKN